MIFPPTHFVSFLDDPEKKELLRELRKAYGMEDKVRFFFLLTSIPDIVC